MRYVFYNPEIEDLKGHDNDDRIIIDLKDRYPGGVCYSELKQKYRRKSQSWLQRWSNKKVKYGESIKDVLTIEGKSYFYLLSYFLQRYFDKEKIMFKDSAGVQHILMIIDLLDRYVKEGESFTVISRDPNGNLFISLCNSIAEKKKCSLTIYEREYSFKNNSFITNNLGRILKLKSFFSWFTGSKGRLYDKTKGSIIFLSSNRFNRKKDEDNVMFGNIIKELRKKGLPYKIIEYSPASQLVKLSVNNNLIDYYNLKVLKQNKVLQKQLINTYYYELSSAWNHTFNYKGINFYHEILPLLNKLFFEISYLIADNINITKRILEVEKPSCVIVAHEEEFYAKGLIMNGAKVVALQHEAVLPGDTNHSHIKGSNDGRPLPMMKCVSGPLAKKVLLKECNYPKNIIKITGRSEFDDLIKRDKVIIEGKPVILYAAEYIPVTKLFYEAIEYLKKYYLFVIKPHPMHKEFPKTEGVMIVNKHDDVHELINYSDLVITTNCTVALEALWAGKKVINYNPFREKDPWQLNKKAGVPEAHNNEQLKELIRNHKNIKINCKKYLREQLYKNDGKATKRVLEVIRECIKA